MATGSVREVERCREPELEQEAEPKEEKRGTGPEARHAPYNLELISRAVHPKGAPNSRRLRGALRKAAQWLLERAAQPGRRIVPVSIISRNESSQPRGRLHWLSLESWV